jgi:hypothetical protein
MLDQDNPILESQAVFAWATREQDDPTSARQTFLDYRSSRRHTLERLDGVPISHWWRTGQHQEFGEVTIIQQASYFAAHELTHIPQMIKLGDRSKQPH